MARAGTINISFTGDARQATRALQDVERGLEGVAEEAVDVGRQMDRATADFDRLDDAAGNTERGLRGLNDGIGGSTAILGTFGVAAGGTVGEIGGLVQGFTDLAGFVGDFATQVLPPLLTKMGVLTAATGTETTAQYALNTAFLANPIFLIIAAIVALTAAFVVAYNKSETFRNIINDIWAFIRDDMIPVLQTLGRVLLGIATLGLSELAFNFGVVSGAARDAAGAIGFVFTGAVDFAHRTVDGLSDGIGWLIHVFGDLWGWANDLGGHIYNQITRAFEVAHEVVDGVSNGISWLIRVIGDLIGQLTRIRWPSPPGWITGTVGRGASIVSGIGGAVGLGAVGAIVTRPTGAIIGEAGPEAVIPLNRMPGASALPGGMGGGIVINVSSFDPKAAGRLVQDALLQLGFGNGGRTGFR